MSFNSSPDFENAADAGANNVYDIIVTAAPDNAHPNVTKTVTITVTDVNEAPVNSVPGTQGVNEEATLTFSTGNGNAITISDQDVGSGDATVTLSVTGGTLSLGSTAGLTSASPPDNAASITLSGTMANIDAALNGLTYTGSPNFSGAGFACRLDQRQRQHRPRRPAERYRQHPHQRGAGQRRAGQQRSGPPQTVNEDTNLVFTRGEQDLDLGCGRRFRRRDRDIVGWQRHADAERHRRPHLGHRRRHVDSTMLTGTRAATSTRRWTG